MLSVKLKENTIDTYNLLITHSYEENGCEYTTVIQKELFVDLDSDSVENSIDYLPTLIKEIYDLGVDDGKRSMNVKYRNN
jgi:hypothetical protein